MLLTSLLELRYSLDYTSCILIAGVSYGCWLAYTVKFHPLAKFPGPLLASISRLWIALEILRGDADKTQQKLHKLHGPIVRIAPNEVAISDPEALKVIYGINSGFQKTDFYLPWRPAFCRYPDHFTSTDEKLHAQRKKIVNNIYSMSSVLKSEPFIDSCTELFLERMGGHARNGKPIDLAKWVQWYAFDVIGELYLSSMFGFMEKCEDHGGYISALETLLPLIVTASVLPSYVRGPLVFSGFFVPGIRKALNALAKIRDASYSCVRDRMTGKKEGVAYREDTLEQLFGILESRRDSAEFNTTDIQVEVFIGLFAGSDTTAIALSSVFYHLMKHPAAYRKLEKEVDEASAAGKLSHPRIRYSEAMELPYLTACCKEAMRMIPSVGLTLPRIVPRGGRYIAGQWFDGGVRVGVNAAVIHFNKEVFGDDAEEFNPERWFRANASRMDRYMFQFGGGPRTCIGKNISLCEIHKLVPEVLRLYRFEMVDPAEELKTMNRWFNKPRHLDVVVKNRSADM